MLGPGLSGGSLVSSSVTFAESTVTVHCSFAAKSLSGLAVQVTWSLELRTLVCEPELAQEIDTAVMVTASVQVMLTFAKSTVTVHCSFAAKSLNEQCTVT